jgi:hypothetical protein
MPESQKPLIRPHGLIEINKTFGDINQYCKQSKDGVLILSPAFESRYIVRLNLPIKLRPPFNDWKAITSIRCHKLLAEYFREAFNEISNRKLPIYSFGGCYTFRQKRSGAGLSAHAWGIAIDLNPETNRYGTSGDMAPQIVEIFQKYGFLWGGAWSGKTRDPMHFQYCYGY